MRILLILAGLTLSLVATSQEIWRWVDKDGVVHYADQPGAPDATLVTIVDPNSYGNEASPDAASSDGNPADSTANSAYGSISIVQPTHDQVFFGTDAVVSVVAELDGSLQSGQSIVFYVDGSRRPATSESGIELTGLSRGSHFLRATVADANGEALMSSQQVTFHIRQTSVRNPQNPQTSRPPAAPRPTPAPAPTPTPSPTPRPIPPGT